MMFDGEDDTQTGGDTGMPTAPEGGDTGDDNSGDMGGGEEAGV